MTVAYNQQLKIFNYYKYKWGMRLKSPSQKALKGPAKYILAHKSLTIRVESIKTTFIDE